MNWTTISEGVISTVVGTLVSAFLIFLTKSLFYKKSEITQKNEQVPIFQDLFLITLFLTSFFIVLTFFSLVYQWVTFNAAYLILASIGLGFTTVLTYRKQCPNCRRVIHAKKLMKKETLSEEKRPYIYRDETVYLYTDGTVKDRVFNGPQKTIMETWRMEKESYECESCHYKWEEAFEKNLSANNRPKPTRRKTNYRNPNNFG